MTDSNNTQNPKAFISYAWESEAIKSWVKQLATQLRGMGIDARLDQWEVVLGDQMPHFMERSVRENDYVLIVCSPKYKTKSDNRLGGVGYEGDIMTAEVLQTSNQRKFIPILQSGTSQTSIPSWLQGKYFIDLSNEAHFQKNFEDLLATLLKSRETAPPLGIIADRLKPKENQGANPAVVSSPEISDIKIKGILVDEVTEPLRDGSRGSALYKIPFELNIRPNYEWAELFIQAWNRPPQFTSMHRPGIASVSGNKIYLDGTTIEEVERYHKTTLKLAVGVANDQYKANKNRQSLLLQEEQKKREQHKKSIEEASKRINFDD